MTNENETEHFNYLDTLRESGRTNMYGAGPYLEERFGLDHHKASEILLKWMDTFSQRHPA